MQQDKNSLGGRQAADPQGAVAAVSRQSEDEDESKAYKFKVSLEEQK